MSKRKNRLRKKRKQIKIFRDENSLPIKMIVGTKTKKELEKQSNLKGFVHIGNGLWEWKREV